MSSPVSQTPVFIAFPAGKPSLQLSPELTARLSDPEELLETVTLNGRKYTVERPIAAGFKGIVWKVVDSFAILWALKLCIHED